MKVSEQIDRFPKSIPCEVCGRMFSGIRWPHLKYHGFTMAMYKEKFPNALILTNEERSFMSNRLKGSLNPAFQHGGKFSPFSKKFIKGDVSKEVSKKAHLSRDKNHGNTGSLEYYTERLGMSEKDAKIALHDHQSTFSKENLIQKHGIDKGTEIWQARQDKWQATLKSKSPEEINRINRSKSFCNKNNANAGLQSYYLKSTEQGFLYLIEYIPIIGGKSYLKFGITKRGLYERYKMINVKKIDGLYIGTCPDVFLTEQTIKKFVHKNKLLTEDAGFPGHTESLELSEENIKKLVNLVPGSLIKTADHTRPTK